MISVTIRLLDRYLNGLVGATADPGPHRDVARLTGLDDSLKRLGNTVEGGGAVLNQRCVSAGMYLSGLDGNSWRTKGEPARGVAGLKAAIDDLVARRGAAPLREDRPGERGRVGERALDRRHGDGVGAGRRRGSADEAGGGVDRQARGQARVEGEPASRWFG